VTDAPADRASVPFVARGDRLRLTRLDHEFVRVVGRYGFMQHADVPELLADAEERLGVSLGLANATYFLGRETFLATPKGKMGPVTEGILAFLSRNARSATSYFAIPTDQVVEIGSQIDL
jgi:KUP system potassium uptake protein